MSGKGNERDDFLSSTKELIAKRSGYICAYPGCKRMTIAGSNDRASGLTVTGIAAHITAASKKGPRYDPDMSHDERASENNGIWTCQIHGKFIDDNPSNCTVAELRRWKNQHEKWVFDRVESGKELFNNGLTQIRFCNLGAFSLDHKIPIGRHNVLVGSNDSGKTTVCELLSAFSGVNHWQRFNKRFKFSAKSLDRPFIEVSHHAKQIKTTIRLSPQFIFPAKKITDKSLQRILIEVNGCIAPILPTSLFKVLLFDTQLYKMHSSDPKDTFIKALRYLANTFGVDENFIWDCLREDLFANSVFGYRFKRTGRRKVEILVPDGREFYLPHGRLSFTEQQIAFLDIAIKLTDYNSNHENWLYIFDSTFFQRLDKKRKTLIFSKLSESTSNYQTLFCLHSAEDAELLQNLKSDKWANAEHFEKLTIHSFI
jgi:hypothetical protein